MGLLNKKNIDKLDSDWITYKYDNPIINDTNFVGISSVPVSKIINPKKGDIVFYNNEYYIFIGVSWEKIGGIADLISVPSDIANQYANVTIDNCSRIN